MAIPSLRQQGETSLSLPQGSYIYSLCRNGDEALAVISSDNSLRCFDRRTLQLLPDGVINDTHSGSGGVTCLCEVDSSSNSYNNNNNAGQQNRLMATAGMDGTVKLWDTRTAAARSKAIAAFSTDRQSPLSSLACNAATNTLVAGTELVRSEASIAFWDIRFPSKPRLQYVESHNDDVTKLQFHPSRNNVLLSGSTDGLVNIYDTTVTDENDALLQVVKHSSIHDAGFVGEDNIYALSHDELFSIHRLNYSEEDTAGPPAIQFGDLRPVLKCEYVAQVLVDGGAAYVAAGKTSEQNFSLFPVMPTPQFHFGESNVWNLLGAHGDELVRSIYMDSQSKTVFTCGEDGFVRSWKEEHKEEGDQHAIPSIIPGSDKSSRPSKKLHSKKGHKERGYKPY